MLKLPRRWRNLSDARHAVSSHLRGRHPLRLHSFLLFLFTLVCAFLAAKISYVLGLTALAPRYLLTCSVGYGAFLSGVHIWLRHVNVNGEEVSENVSLPNDNVTRGGKDIGLGDGIEVVGEVFTAGEGCLFVFVVAIGAALGAWLISVLGAEILIDVALEALLAGSLVGALKIGREPNWLLRLLIKTAWIYLAVLFSALIFAHVAHKRFPEATTTREVIQLMKQ